MSRPGGELANWTTPAELRERVQRLWDHGRLLASESDGGTPFPLTLRLRGPGASELGERMEEVRQWMRALEEGAQAARGRYSLEWEEVNPRNFGRNRVPRAAIVESRQQAIEWIGRHAQAQRFAALVAQTTARLPPLGPWLKARPMVLLEHEREWERVLAVLEWFRAHPRSGRYLRQLDVTGGDSKFVEARRGLFTELLDLVLPPEAIEAEARGARSFERRYGLRAKPALVRFRLLDPAMTMEGLLDLTVPIAEFASLSPALLRRVQRVFITENEVNGLAFPAATAAIVIFGLGYGVELLGGVPWLGDAEIHYWGDLDTHGFSILDRLRGVLPAARSLLMDRETLMEHRALWGAEDEPHRGELARLGVEERELYDELRLDRLGERVRLEQERIRFGWVEAAIAGV